MAELILRGGTIVDGTGAAPFPGDVAVSEGRITAVDQPGALPTNGARVIDAEGLLVTPGFVDIHTHFDGQATWDPLLAPSSWHGVTTVAMGNCGVGFAPAHPERHDWLIGLLEGVEDIPGTALAEGLAWDWETFPQYLDALARRPHAVDLGVHVPHAALRTYVMGERGADHTARPSDDELDTLARLVGEALDAGALGFATSRTEVHRTREGTNIGTLSADERELLTIAGVLRKAGRGVTQLISDCYQTADDSFANQEFDLIEAYARTSGRPVSFTVQQAYHSPDRWRHLFGRVAALNAQGIDIKAQIAPRPVGILLGLAASTNPFILCPSYQELAALPVPERVVALRDPERRRRILAEHTEIVAKLPAGLLRQIVGAFDLLFKLTDPVDYELDEAHSLAADARRAGVEPGELIYDLLLERDGEQLLYLPLFNFASHDFDDLFSMITSPHTLFGLSDAGAHCGAVCDASFTTSSLVLWGRDRRGGERLPIEWLVHANSQRNARHVGWFDRGVVAPGMLADLNVIDLEALGCRPPEIIKDLPAGGRRLVQRADGYRYTVKSGTVTFEDGVSTGELPGELVRGGRSVPTA
jgi:N-acyl-D-amino-acid deacylase